MGTPIILNSLDYKPSIIIFLKKKKTFYLIMLNFVSLWSVKEMS